MRFFPSQIVVSGALALFCASPASQRRKTPAWGKYIRFSCVPKSPWAAKPPSSHDNGCHSAGVTPDDTIDNSTGREASSVRVVGMGIFLLTPRKICPRRCRSLPRRRCRHASRFLPHARVERLPRRQGVRLGAPFHPGLVAGSLGVDGERAHSTLPRSSGDDVRRFPLRGYPPLTIRMYDIHLLLLLLL